MKAVLTVGGIDLIYRMALPDADEVETQYLAAHPERKIKNMLPGQGDSNAVQFQIRYEDPLTSHSGEDVWIFEWKGNEWAGVSKGPDEGKAGN